MRASSTNKEAQHNKKLITAKTFKSIPAFLKTGFTNPRLKNKLKRIKGEKRS
jgi:hypothetical protein